MLESREKVLEEVSKKQGKLAFTEEQRGAYDSLSVLSPSPKAESWSRSAACRTQDDEVRVGLLANGALQERRTHRATVGHV